MTPRQYVDRVSAGAIYDSTLSFQLGRGFEVRGLLEDYIEDDGFRQLGDIDRVGESFLPARN